MPAAFAQSDFTLTATSFNPIAVDPGISSVTHVSVSPLNGFTGSVDITCTITPVVLTSPPVCSPTTLTVTPPVSGPAITLTTTGLTPAGTYTITLTGTGGGQTQTFPLTLTVLPVTPDYTVTVQSTLSPSSVHSGYGATAVIAITPVNGYTGTVTPSCSLVTPSVTVPPVCSFNPETVQVSTSAVQTTTLTVNTFNPSVTTTTGENHGPRPFYALMIPLPALALIGVGLSGTRYRRFLGIVLGLTLAASLLLLPACGNSTASTQTTTSTTGTTPKNTYTITLAATDDQGTASSNTDPSPTVSLTVN
jgi:hypothetical protein